MHRTASLAVDRGNHLKELKQTRYRVETIIGNK